MQSRMTAGQRSGAPCPLFRRRRNPRSRALQRALIGDGSGSATRSGDTPIRAPSTCCKLNAHSSFGDIRARFALDEGTYSYAYGDIMF
jgi:hypothetical protein